MAPHLPYALINVPCGQLIVAKKTGQWNDTSHILGRKPSQTLVAEKPSIICFEDVCFLGTALAAFWLERPLNFALHALHELLVALLVISDLITSDTKIRPTVFDHLLRVVSAGVMNFLLQPTNFALAASICRCKESANISASWALEFLLRLNYFAPLADIASDVSFKLGLVLAFRAVLPFGRVAGVLVCSSTLDALVIEYEVRLPTVSTL